jgi:hypothetical protein
MSLAGQVDWKRSVIGDWATEMLGKPAATAPAVPVAAADGTVAVRVAWYLTWSPPEEIYWIAGKDRAVPCAVQSRCPLADTAIDGLTLPESEFV